jgi:hypothetical protein
MRRKDWRNILGICVILSSALLSGGCWDTQISLMPNPDPALRKSSAEYAADAVKRHPFKADLPSGGQAVANAQVDYGLNRLEIVNLSNDTWNNVEIWVNRDYVVFLPRMESKVLKRIPFSVLYDGHGKYFQQNNKNFVDSVILIRGDKQFTVPVQLAD